MNIEPPPTNGINVWMLSSARKCQLAGLPAREAEQMIRSYDGAARRSFKDHEVRRAVERAYNTTLEDRPPKTWQKNRWQPEKTRRTTWRVRNSGIEMVDLWEASPIRMDGCITQEMILEALFPDSAGLLCVGQSAYKFKTAPRWELQNLDQAQFIVPCYMSAVYGTTQDGKRSMHCLENTGSRRFCVCDFDEPASDLHPSIIWHLKDLAPLVMVLSSGGKSLHAWFKVPAHAESDFWKVAIEHGADAALMRNRSSFVRMPEGTRDNGKRQGVVYFDPAYAAKEWEEIE